MKKGNLILLFLLTLTTAVRAQNPAISNQVSLGGTSTERPKRLIQSPVDNGYYLFSVSNSPVSGNKTEPSRGGDDLWIVKTDENFNIEWEKTLGGSGMDYYQDAGIIDGKIYVALSSGSNSSGEKTMNCFGVTDIWFLCLDLDGTILWQNQYGGSDEEYNASFISKTDTSLLLVCDSRSLISGNKTVDLIGGSDIWILEIGMSNGAIVQQTAIGSDGYESHPFIKRNPYTAEYVLWCQSTGGISGNKTEVNYGTDDIWMVKLTDNLGVLQDKSFGGDLTEFALTNESVLIEESEIYLAALTYSSSNTGNLNAINNGVNDAWLLKLGHDLEIIWSQTYGGSSPDACSKIERNVNGKLILSANSGSIPATGNKTSPAYGNGDLWLLILDDDGSILAQESYGGTGSDGGLVFPAANSNTELILVATSESPVSGNKTVGTWGQEDIWLAKLDASDFLNTVELSGTQSTVSVYPNPFNETANFKFQDLNEAVQISFYSLDGKLIDVATLPQGTNFYEWNSVNSEQFIVYEINGQTVNHKGKLVKE